MAINKDNRVIHRFIRDISSYEMGGEFYSQIIPLDTQAYANYPNNEGNKLFYVIGDGEHTYTELRDGKGTSDVYREYPVFNEENLHSIVDGIEQEITDRKAADLVLQGEIDQEIQDRTNAIEALANQLSEETGERISFDEDLSEALLDETRNRESAISDLSDALDAYEISTQSALDTKLNKVSESLKIYGTDNDGEQTVYEFNDFGKVDDVKVGNTSVVTNKIATLGTIASKSVNNYYDKDTADITFATKSLETTVSNHILDENNPHSVTKNQVGLGNVDNTSDVNKPISTATQNALDGKQDSLTEIQLNAVNSGVTSSVVAQVSVNTEDISDIDEKIPEQASSLNQLADKEFVNSSIATNTAKFIGTFGSVAELNEYSGTVTNNDYAFVINSTITDNGNDWATFNDLDLYNKSLLTNFDYAWVINGSKFDLYRFDIVEQDWVLRVSNTDKEDVTLNIAYNRYKANVESNIRTWDYEYTLNNSSFTASQWAAINSGATQSNIAQISTNETAISNINSSAPMVSGITSTKVSNYDSHVADSTIHVTSLEKQTWDAKQNALTAGTNVSISAENVISATDTTYSAGTGISIDNNVISNTKLETYTAFPNSWTTDGTVSQLMTDITNDTNATKYMAYLGEVTCSDLPFNGNAEMMIYIMDNADGQQGKVIYAVLNSGNISPYHWEMTYWNGHGTWRSFIPTSEIDSAPTASSTNVITSGGVYTALGNKQDTLTSSNAGTGISITTQQGIGIIISNTQNEPEGFTASEVQTIWDSVNNE